MHGSEYVLILFVLLAYKSLIIVAGLVIIYLGYCFLITAYEKAEKENDKEAAPKQNKFILTGAIFASFGAGVLICSMLQGVQGIDIQKTREIVSEKSGFTKEVELILEKVINQEQVNEKERQVLSEILKKKNLEQEDAYYHECNNYNN